MRFLILCMLLSCAYFVGCNSSSDVVAREIPTERPSGFSTDDAPAGKPKKDTSNNNALTDAPIE